jgi:hypothetical protein
MQQEHEALAMTGNRTVQKRIAYADPLVSDQGRIGKGHGVSLVGAVIDGLYNHGQSWSGKDRIVGSALPSA